MFSSAMYLPVILLAFLAGGQIIDDRCYDKKYKMLKVVPNAEQFAIVHALVELYKLEVWQNSTLYDKPWVILVPNERVADLKHNFDFNDIKYEFVTYGDQFSQEEVEEEEEEAFFRRSRPQLPKVKAGVGVVMDRYYQYNTIASYMKNMAKQFRNKVTLLKIGKTYENRDLLGVKISSGGSKKPAILIDAGIHPREWMAPAMGLHIISQLIENPKYAQLSKKVDWYIIPVLNPDGYIFTFTGGLNRMWRKTRSRQKRCYGVDANRNWGFHWNETGMLSSDECSELYVGPRAFSEPETRALRDFALKHKAQIKLYLTFHSFGEVLVYPWGWTSALPDNAAELHSLAARVKNAIGRVRGTNYTIGSSTNVYYAASGGSDDWMLGVAKIPLAYTLELPGRDRGFDPPASEIQGVVDETFVGVIEFLKYVRDKWA